ncbi:FAD dependent oxidoreductase [Gloeopeniophorella convolvens]|nr:FAD dependent oxidoreductase [Gloeopeniophorella convolvens]
MGNVLSQIKMVIALLRELDAEYRAVKERVERSPGLPVPEPTTPFWTVPPANLPTSADAALPSHADVVVIGSGITSASCVRTLLKRGPPGLRIVVLEARDVCTGATGRNGGHVNPPLFHDYKDLKAEFGLDAAKRIIRFRLAHLPALREAVEEADALEHSQLRDIEKLDVYFDQKVFDEQKQALEQWRADMPEEAAGSYVVEGKEASQKFGLSEQVVGVIASPGGAAHPYRIVTSVFAKLLSRYSDQLSIFAHTPCTEITPPSAPSLHYTAHTPRGTLSARHIIHATNGWSSHLLPGMRGKLVPVRGLMTAQRPGTGLPAPALATTPARAHVFYHAPPGYDYLTQLPTVRGELMFGGGAAQGGRVVLSEFGLADDGAYALGIAAHVGGALPEYFGRAHWGGEARADPAEEGEGWAAGRVKALWTGVLGISTDLQPWVGRVPARVSGRAVPAHSEADADAGDGKDAGGATAPAGEWLSGGYTGEGMVHAWLCAHALALMVLGREEDERVREWFPDAFRITEHRWKRASLERLAERF